MGHLEFPVKCPICDKPVRVTNEGKFYRHGNCDAGGTWASTAENHSRELTNTPTNFSPLYSGSPSANIPQSPTSFTDANEWLMNDGGKSSRPEPVPMTGLAAELAARLRETFYAYTTRRSEDNRSAQTHLGPSEIGTPCDRRLAMSLLRVAPVNPGGDGWAAFVGTCVHVGLAEMLTWADAGSGRYATEIPFSFPSVHVPRGTGDALDRVLCLFLDHKVMGRWSLDKLRSKGPIPTYRVQVHVYAQGARARGERVDHVAIVGWPREGSNLDDLYVWTEPYDPVVARDALGRVDRIAEQVERLTNYAPMAAAQQFPIADDCKFCPFHLPNGDNTIGCNGRP